VYHDGWRERRCPPELTNFVIRQLAKFKYGVYGVPGQHDLPHHRLDQLSRSAFWTLVEAGVLKYLAPGEPQPVASPGPKSRLVYLHGFPWGVRPGSWDRAKTPHENAVHVAAVHAYCWLLGHAHPGARSEDNANAWKIRLERFGFYAAAFGDNHRGFVCQAPRDEEATGPVYPPLLNCGGFAVRNRDERDCRPCVGLLRRDGTWDRRPLGGEGKNVYLETAPDEPGTANHREFTELLALMEHLGNRVLDFPSVLQEYLRRAEMSPAVRTLVVAALEKACE
jgi:hypothetical protein